MIRIYKIINDINSKIYVGKTIQTLKQRFYKHCYDAYNDKTDSSILHTAIRKYGQEHFKIELIEEFEETEKNWQEKEQFYIKFFNSIQPNGYNILEGGEAPPINKDELNGNCSISNETIETIILLLCNTSLDFNQIAKQVNVSVSYIHQINMGRYRKRNIEYPIRKYDEYEIRTLKIIELLQQNWRNVDIAKKFQMKANTIASINTGYLYNYLYDGEYPIRKGDGIDQQKRNLALSTINFIKTHKIWSKAWLQKELHINRYVLDKIIAGEAPYQIENQNYPLL